MRYVQVFTLCSAIPLVLTSVQDNDTTFLYSLFDWGIVPHTFVQLSLVHVLSNATSLRADTHVRIQGKLLWRRSLHPTRTSEPARRLQRDL